MDNLPFFALKMYITVFFSLCLITYTSKSALKLQSIKYYKRLKKNEFRHFFSQWNPFLFDRCSYKNFFSTLLSAKGTIVVNVDNFKFNIPKQWVIESKKERKRERNCNKRKMSACSRFMHGESNTRSLQIPLYI